MRTCARPSAARCLPNGAAAGLRPSWPISQPLGDQAADLLPGILLEEMAGV